MKNTVNRILRYFDLRISRHSNSTQGRRQQLLDDLQITLMIDAGANEGQYAQEVRKGGYRGRMLSIEPLDDAFEKLQRKSTADNAWRCINVGVGAVNESRMMNVSGNVQSSSMLGMLETQALASPKSVYVATQEVEVRRLDSILDPAELAGENVWLKADVQGLERKVVEGARRILHRVKAIELELSLVQLYEDQPIMCEDIAYLSRIGYKLVWLKRGYRDTRDGHLLQTDGIFLRY